MKSIIQLSLMGICVLAANALQGAQLNAVYVTTIADLFAYRKLLTADTPAAIAAAEQVLLTACAKVNASAHMPTPAQFEAQIAAYCAQQQRAVQASQQHQSPPAPLMLPTPANANVSPANSAQRAPFPVPVPRQLSPQAAQIQYMALPASATAPSSSSASAGSSSTAPLATQPTHTTHNATQAHRAARAPNMVWNQQVDGPKWQQMQKEMGKGTYRKNQIKQICEPFPFDGLLNLKAKK